MYLSTGLIALGLVSGIALAADDAKSQLMAMATKLAEAKQFSVSMRMGYDAVQKDGQKIEFGEIRKTLISRPNLEKVIGMADLDIALKTGDERANLITRRRPLHSGARENRFHNKTLGRVFYAVRD